MNSDFREIRRQAISLRTIINRITFLSQPLTWCVSRNDPSNTSNRKCKASSFEWFEMKVCLLKFEAVINDQNHGLFLDTLHTYWCCRKMERFTRRIKTVNVFILSYFLYRTINYFFFFTTINRLSPISQSNLGTIKPGRDAFWQLISQKPGKIELSRFYL